VKFASEKKGRKKILLEDKKRKIKKIKGKFLFIKQIMWRYHGHTVRNFVKVRGDCCLIMATGKLN